MYVDISKIKNKTKTYSRCLLRTSFRENGKVKHKTIANLSSCSEDEIKAIKLALKHKNDLTVLSSVKNVKTILGKRIGAVWVMYELAKRLNIVKALGSGLGGKLALLQIIARICDQGSSSNGNQRRYQIKCSTLTCFALFQHLAIHPAHPAL